MLSTTATPLERQTAADVARQHNNQRMHTANLVSYAAKPDFDPGLLRPVAFVPPPPMSEAERARLHSELISLKRERDTTQEAIDFILEKLAA